MFDLLGDIEYKTLVNHKKCLHSLSSKSSCKRCQEACHVGAIRIEEGRVEISRACTNCNNCVNICPTGALVGEEKQYRRQEDTLLISKDKTEGGFLNYLSFDKLAQWYDQGIRRIETDINDYEGFKDRLLIFNRLLEMNGKDSIAFEYKAEMEEEDKHEYDRAEFFKLGKVNFLDLIYGSLGKKEDTSGYFKKLIAGLQVFESPYKVLIDKPCIGCNACLKLCHMEAIKKVDGELLQLGYCNGCNLCRDICPDKVIRLEKSPFLIKISET